MLIHKFSLIIASLGLSGSLAAQGACPNGPGSAFGIVAYQCANCGFKQESGGPAIYSFFAEPVVTQVDYRSSALTSDRPLIVVDGVVQGGVAVGDVIEAVDGHPITTQSGADVFAHPASGSHSLTVRRGRERQVIDVSVPAPCGPASSTSVSVSTGGSGRVVFDTVYLRDDGVHRGAGSGSGVNSASAAVVAGGRGYGRGVPAIGGEPIKVVNGASAPSGAGSVPAVGKFGFAVECRPACTLKRAPSGEYYYKYDAYPRIVEVRDRSAADLARLRVGDLIVKVDGKSILDEDAVRDLDRRDQLRLTVRRDGKDIDVLMLVVR